MKVGRNIKIFIFFSVIIGITIPLLLYNFEVQNPIVWELKISGNVDEEVIIQYQALINGTFGIISDKEFYFINSFGTELYFVFTGVSLWRILNQTGVLCENRSQIQFYFRAYDNYETGKLNLADLQAHPNDVIVAFKQKGVGYLRPKIEGGDGPLRAVVEYNLTKPYPNSQYWAKYLNEIIIL